MYQVRIIHGRIFTNYRVPNPYVYNLGKKSPKGIQLTKLESQYNRNRTILIKSKFRKWFLNFKTRIEYRF